MGCPDIYYKRMLQKGLHDFLYFKDKDRAIELMHESNRDVLEAALEKVRDNSPEFYFTMGMAAGIIYDDVGLNEGCDAYNAMLAGLGGFEALITEDEDEED